MTHWVGASRSQKTWVFLASISAVRGEVPSTRLDYRKTDERADICFVRQAEGGTVDSPDPTWLPPSGWNSNFLNTSSPAPRSFFDKMKVRWGFLLFTVFSGLVSLYFSTNFSGSSKNCTEFGSITDTWTSPCLSYVLVSNKVFYVYAALVMLPLLVLALAMIRKSRIVAWLSLGLLFASVIMLGEVNTINIEKAAATEYCHVDTRVGNPGSPDHCGLFLS